MMLPPPCTEQVIGLTQPIKINPSSLKMLDGLGDEGEQDSAGTELWSQGGIELWPQPLIFPTQQRWWEPSRAEPWPKKGYSQPATSISEKNVDHNSTLPRASDGRIRGMVPPLHPLYGPVSRAHCYQLSQSPSLFFLLTQVPSRTTSFPDPQTAQITWAFTSFASLVQKCVFLMPHKASSCSTSRHPPHPHLSGQPLSLICRRFFTTSFLKGLCHSCFLPLHFIGNLPTKPILSHHDPQGNVLMSQDSFAPLPCSWAVLLLHPFSNGPEKELTKENNLRPLEVRW